VVGGDVLHAREICRRGQHVVERRPRGRQDQLDALQNVARLLSHVLADLAADRMPSGLARDEHEVAEPGGRRQVGIRLRRIWIDDLFFWHVLSPLSGARLVREITMRARRVQPMAKGTLIAAMKLGRVAEDEFHDWYDTEHLPERQRVPGFLVCQRWLGAGDRDVSVATYDLESVAVLEGPAYRAIGGENLLQWAKSVTARLRRLMRFRGGQMLSRGPRPATDDA